MNTLNIAAARSIAAASLAFAITLPAGAAVCNNVTFTLTNTSGGPIMVYEVGYRDLNSSKPSKRITENVSPFSCPSTYTCTSAPQDLGSIVKPRENHDLTDIQFLHSHQDIYGNWLPAVWSTKNTPFSMKCTDGRDYGPYDVN